MSDSFLQFVPADPLYQPETHRAEAAKTLLMSFVPNSQKTSFDFKESVEFFDPGGNWSGVACPACGADLESWWADAMDVAAASGFRRLQTDVPCCGKLISLNELNYVWPAAFGLFVLEAMNPGVSEIALDQCLALEEALGCKLLVVWSHI